MASGHASRQWLEALKFGVYLITPIGATIYLGTGAYPHLERIIHNTSYIKYPAEQGKPPQSMEDLEHSMRQLRREKIEQAKERAATSTSSSQ